MSTYSYVHKIVQIEDGFVSARHPGDFIDQMRDLSSSEESVLLSSLLLLRVDLFLKASSSG